VLDVVKAVRQEMGPKLPLFLRISASDWTEGGWTIEDSVELARCVKPLGVDLIDTSSGGNVPGARIPVEPGYQVPFAQRIRKDSGILTGAVGMITTAEQAESIVHSGQADIVLLARELLRDPYFPMHAAQALDGPARVPAQYMRAYPHSIKRD
jgi:2,4-dienoyl-CoA reductase-like NADH-dependent reductase (Old Yellow Enzyme family)